jgi:hypothetical protein
VRVTARRPSGAPVEFPLALAWDGTDVWAYGRQGDGVGGSKLDGGGAHRVALRAVSAAAALNEGRAIVVAGASPEQQPCLAIDDRLIRLPGKGEVTVWPSLAAQTERIAVAWGAGSHVIAGWCDGRTFELVAVTAVTNRLDRLAVTTEQETITIICSFLSAPGVVKVRMEAGGRSDPPLPISPAKPPMMWVDASGRAVWMTPDHRRLAVAEGDELSLPAVGQPTTAELVGGGIFVWVTSGRKSRSAAWAAAVDFDLASIGEPVRISEGRGGLAAVATGGSTAVVVQDGSPPSVADIESL